MQGQKHVRPLAMRSRRRCVRTRLGLSLLLGISLCLSAPMFARDDMAAQLKAAIVFKLGRYVSWPDHALGAQNGRLTICVLGDFSVADALAGVRGREVAGRRVAVHEIDAGDTGDDCGLLFIGARSIDVGSALVRDLAERPVLTVSDATDFARGYGIIELVERDRRLGFRVNLNNAHRARVRISSSLLDLAELIEGEREEDLR